MTAFLETPSAIRRRRAFLAGLEPMIGRDAALEAISLWEHAFGSDQPLLRGISQFAALAVVELNLQLNPNDLSLRLLEHLQKDEASLPPDPLPLLAGRAAASAPAAAPDSLATAAAQGAAPVTQTLSALLVKLCDAAGQADARSQGALVRQFVAACARRLDAPTAQDVAALLGGRSAMLMHDYSPTTGNTLVNLFYVPLAELYGPITADRILGSAVRTVEQMAEARAFAPRDLL